MDSWSEAWMLKEASGARCSQDEKGFKAGPVRKEALQSRQSWAKSQDKDRESPRIE